MLDGANLDASWERSESVWDDRDEVSAALCSDEDGSSQGESDCDGGLSVGSIDVREVTCVDLDVDDDTDCDWNGGARSSSNFQFCEDARLVM